MPDDKQSNISLSRRQLLQLGVVGFGAVSLGWIGEPPAHAQPSNTSNPTSIENQRSGSTAWQLTNPATNREIEGYASLTSVNRGGSIDLFVSTGAATFTLTVFRMGWYGGLGGRQVYGPITVPGLLQPTPSPDPQFGMIECQWSKSYTLSINNPNDSTDWCSGVYLVKLTASTGKQSYIMFVVRDDSRTSDFLFNSCVTTFQAYNTWGGKCLYDYLSPTGKSNKVSFNRPYALNKAATALQFGVGAAEFLLGSDGGPPGGWEYCTLRFLERNGYDVTYCTSVDVHQTPNLLWQHKGYLVSGHDEYWSQEMRNNILAAVGNGVSAAIMTANGCYWQIRFETSPQTGAANRTIVCYKGHPDSTISSGTLDPYYSDGIASNDNLITVRWRDSLPNSSRTTRPEEALLGTMYVFEADSVNDDLVVADASNWVFTNTGAVESTHLPGLLGYEIDAMQGNSPPGTVSLCHSYYPANSSIPAGYSDMTIYTANSGAIFFTTGTVQWAWGLDDWGATGVYPYYGNTSRDSVLNSTAQQMTANILGTIQAGPVPDTSNVPIAQPGGPYSCLVQLPVELDGSASFAPAGVAQYTWQFGDGTSGSGILTTHTYAQPGSYTLMLTVVDNSGQSGSASTTVTVNNVGQQFNIFPGPVYPNPAFDPNAVELGVKFFSDMDGQILGIRFYKNGSDGGTHTGTLWTGGGQLLAGATFTNETSSGWQQVLFNAPVAITAGTVYIASYHTSAGNYCGDLGYFSGGQADNGPLHALMDGASGGNGVYRYGASGFPNQTYLGTNYWADVVFVPTSSATVSLASITVQPNTVTGGSSATGTATLNAAAPGNGAVVTLSSSGSAASVPATVTIGAGTTSNQFPVSTSSVSTETVVTITGTYNGTQSTTIDVEPGAATVSIWPSSATPGTSSWADSNSVELGCRFVSNVNGFIEGVRFYKGSGNTGTHVGSLWTNSGQLLAQVTFANETASGWQQALFNNRVAITAGTVYVVSYHAPVGHYAGDHSYFANSGAGASSVKALQDGTSGHNGIYLYGSGGFPSNTYLSTNYWVDVVFSST
jgi:hypothetical protein